MYKTSFIKTLIVIFNSIVYLLIIIAMIIFSHYYLETNLILFGISCFVILYLPFFTVLSQHIIKGTPLSISDRGILYKNKTIPKEQIQKIQLIESKNRKGYDAAYFYPGGDGELYYFRITLANRKKLYVTCLMDRKNDFEEKLKKFEFQYEYTYRLIPLIFQ